MVPAWIERIDHRKGRTLGHVHDAVSVRVVPLEPDEGGGMTLAPPGWGSS